MKMKYHDLARSQRTNFLWRCKMHHMGLLHSTEWVETREQDKIHHLWVSWFPWTASSMYLLGRLHSRTRSVIKKHFIHSFVKKNVWCEVQRCGMELLVHSFEYITTFISVWGSTPANKFQLKLYTHHNLQTESSILPDTSSPWHGINKLTH